MSSKVAGTIHLFQDPALLQLQRGQCCAKGLLVATVVTAVALAILIALGASGVISSNTYVLAGQAVLFVGSCVLAVLLKMGFNHCQTKIDIAKYNLLILDEYKDAIESYEAAKKSYERERSRENATTLLAAGKKLYRAAWAAAQAYNRVPNLGELPLQLTAIAQEHHIEFSLTEAVLKNS